MSLFLVLLGGELTVTARLKRQISGARVIAADSGIRHADALGVEPELWVGDFDSSPDALRKRYADVEQLKFPAAKAKTDGELAIEAALGRGATKIVMAGGFGGARTDHALGNLTLMMAQAGRGCDIMMTSGNEEAWPLGRARHRLDLPDGTLFSVIAFDALKGLLLEGARWPLDNADVEFGSSLTVSNEVNGKLSASVKAGKAAILAQMSVF
jgi:thiamine pyrophosphokinase